MDQPYPWSSVSHVEMAQRWLLGVFQTGFVPSPQPFPHSLCPPAYSLGVYLSVCYVHVFKCTVSVSTCTQGGLLLVYMIGCFSVYIRLLCLAEWYHL